MFSAAELPLSLSLSYHTKSHPGRVNRDKITLMLAALVSVRMLMADGTGGFQLATQIRFRSGLGIALGAQDNLNPPLVEDVHSAAAFAAQNRDFHCAPWKPPWKCVSSSSFPSAKAARADGRTGSFTLSRKTPISERRGF